MLPQGHRLAPPLTAEAGALASGLALTTQVPAPPHSVRLTWSRVNTLHAPNCPYSTTQLPPNRWLGSQHLLCPETMSQGHLHGLAPHTHTPSTHHTHTHMHTHRTTIHTPHSTHHIPYIPHTCTHHTYTRHHNQIHHTHIDIHTTHTYNIQHIHIPHSYHTQAMWYGSKMPPTLDLTPPEIVRGFPNYTPREDGDWSAVGDSQTPSQSLWPQGRRSDYPGLGQCTLTP